MPSTVGAWHRHSCQRGDRFGQEAEHGFVNELLTAAGQAGDPVAMCWAWPLRLLFAIEPPMPVQQRGAPSRSWISDHFFPALAPDPAA